MGFWASLICRSHKAPDQPTSEPQQTAEGQKEPDVKDVSVNHKK